jgi:hypothetical protein
MVFPLLPFVLSVYAVSTGDQLSLMTLLLSTLFLPFFIHGTRSLSFYPEELVVRVLGIPYRRIPLEKIDGLVLVPTYSTGRHSIPPAAVAVLKPGTAEGYCSERGLKRTRMVNCPNVSVDFNWSQSYHIWAVLEANGIQVIEFDDVGDF